MSPECRQGCIPGGVHRGVHRGVHQAVQGVCRRNGLPSHQGSLTRSNQSGASSEHAAPTRIRCD